MRGADGANALNREFSMCVNLRYAPQLYCRTEKGHDTCTNNDPKREQLSQLETALYRLLVGLLEREPTFH